jgi:hypothetical protein
MSMSGRLIKEDLFTKYSIVDNGLPEGQQIHDFLQARAKALAGKYIDFDKTPVTFVLSDDDAPNAFFAPGPDPENDKNPRRNDYETTRALQNPAGTPVICVTRGLLEMVDNLDQLDFVLGHELTHMIMRQHGVEQNSKGEEEIADIHSVDLMYDAGSDPKEALVMSGKISAYVAEERRKNRIKIHGRDREKETGIIWSEIFDVHMTDENRKAGIETSLTRLSHLIDDLTPTAIDKTPFDVRYDDPIHSFLRANDYEGKKPLGKLKVLIDCIDHISGYVPAEEYFQAEIDALPAEGTVGYDYSVENKLKALQAGVDAGYSDYFGGPTIEKKYQQKIASLAEGIFDQVEAERKYKGHENKPAVINTKDLRAYLHDKAYQHIDEHGYPKAGEFNYLDASGLLYTYFHSLFSSNEPRRRRSVDEDDEPEESRKLPQLETDINTAKANMGAVSTGAEFLQAAQEFERLIGIRHEIQTAVYGADPTYDKLDNLSPVSGSSSNTVFPKLKRWWL